MSTSDDKELERQLQLFETKDVSKTANRMVEKCFDKCVPSIRSKHMSQGEIDCVKVCTSKYLELTNRISNRFTEIQKMEISTIKFPV